MTTSTLQIKEGARLRGHVKLIASKACQCDEYKRTGGYCRHKIGSPERPIVGTTEVDNTIMQSSMAGLDFVIQWIIGQMASGQGAAAYAGGVSYGEIGTGTTTPAVSDTALTTPIARTTPTTQEDYAYQEAVLQFYWPDAALANDTFTEFGTFCGGSTSLGTGQIFNHALFTTAYTKSSGEDITVQVTFNISQ